MIIIPIIIISFGLFAKMKLLQKFIQGESEKTWASDAL